MTVESMAGEFDQQASVIASRLHELPEVEQIAAACRGSGNPAALSWLAECLGLDDKAWVSDLGAGIGGRSRRCYRGRTSRPDRDARGPLSYSKASRIERFDAWARAGDAITNNCLVLGTGFGRLPGVDVRQG